MEVVWQADSRARLLSDPAHAVRRDSLVQLRAFYGLQTGCSRRTNSYNVASCIQQKSWYYCSSLLSICCVQNTAKNEAERIKMGKPDFKNSGPGLKKVNGL